VGDPDAVRRAGRGAPADRIAIGRPETGAGGVDVEADDVRHPCLGRAQVLVHAGRLRREVGDGDVLHHDLHELRPDRGGNRPAVLPAIEITVDPDVLQVLLFRLLTDQYHAT